MLCDACKKNEATYHTIRQYNGIKTETHLCAECRRKFVTGGISDFANAFFSDFSSVFGNAKKTRVCAECGTTEEEFLNTGYVGCENCYKEFANLILPRVSQMQQGLVHVGKMPAVAAATAEGEYARLKAELKKAVDAEDYERAAKINLKLKKLKNDAQNI